MYKFYMAELPQVHTTFILSMHPNCLYAGPRDWTWVATVLGEALYVQLPQNSASVLALKIQPCHRDSFV